MLGIHRAMQALQAQAKHEPEFASMAVILQSCLDQAQDVLHSVQVWSRRSDLDPQRLAQLDERLGLWISLARRFKRSPEDLPTLVQQWQAQLAELDQATDLERLKNECERCEQAYRQLALSMRRARVHV